VDEREKEKTRKQVVTGHERASRRQKGYERKTFTYARNRREFIEFFLEVPRQRTPFHTDARVSLLSENRLLGDNEAQLLEGRWRKKRGGRGGGKRRRGVAEEEEVEEEGRRRGRGAGGGGEGGGWYHQDLEGQRDLLSTEFPKRMTRRDITLKYSLTRRNICITYHKRRK